MQNLSEAFLNARGHAAARGDETAAEDFRRGVDWVRNVLVPAVERGNGELQHHHVSIRLDLNLDSRSTNHAHADFWFVKAGGFAGPKYSINVLGGHEVWLYKAGVPGRMLGTTDHYGNNEFCALLCDAANEFGGHLPRNAA